MPKIVDEQMREATRRRILRVAASEFARAVQESVADCRAASRCPYSNKLRGR